jgi:post-segregation antitoxin (ccd killing protein)
VVKNVKMREYYHRDVDLNISEIIRNSIDKISITHFNGQVARSMKINISKQEKIDLTKALNSQKSLKMIQFYKK